LAGGAEGGECNLIVLDPATCSTMLSPSGVQVSMRNVKWVLNVAVISAPLPQSSSRVTPVHPTT
jgi:hypothetical protein